ncbi:hypothetical protein DFP73DRAFT_544227, partial [Morchella snyderi]
MERHSVGRDNSAGVGGGELMFGLGLVGWLVLVRFVYPLRNSPACGGLFLGGGIAYMYLVYEKILTIKKQNDKR